MLSIQTQIFDNIKVFNHLQILKGELEEWVNVESILFTIDLQTFFCTWRGLHWVFLDA